MRRTRRRAAILFVVVAAMAIAHSKIARADCDPRPEASTCLSSDSLWPKPGPQRFVYVTSPEVVTPGRFGIALVTSYQKRPIVLHVATPGPGGTEAYAIDDQLNATFLPSFGVVDRVSAFVALPTTIYQTGGGSSAATGRAVPKTSSFRDPRVGGALAIVRGERAHVTGYVDVQVPLGATTDFAGEKGFVIAPSIAADTQIMGDRVRLASEIGARARPVTQTFFGERQGTQGIFGVGASVRILRRDLLSVGAEARAIVGVAAHGDVKQDMFGAHTENARNAIAGEWLASVRTALVSESLTILGGAGTNLPLGAIAGVGQLRVVLGVAYTPSSSSSTSAPVVIAPPVKEQAPPPPAPPAPPTKPIPIANPTKNECVATCKADSFSPLPPDDETALATRLTPYLNELRSCLERVGGERIRPAVLVRFSPEGVFMNLRIDVGGYEDLACVKDSRAHIPALSTRRGTSARCELECR